MHFFLEVQSVQVSNTRKRQNSVMLAFSRMKEKKQQCLDLLENIYCLSSGVYSLVL